LAEGKRGLGERRKSGQVLVERVRGERKKSVPDARKEGEAANG
jgi:hypothetical protein